MSTSNPTGVNVRTWEPYTTTVGGSTVSFSVKRLNFLEQKRFALVMARLELDTVFREVGKATRVDEAYSRALLIRLKAAIAEHGLDDQLRAAIDELRAKVKAEGSVAVDPAENVDAVIVLCGGVLAGAGKPIPEPTPDEQAAREAEIAECRQRQAAALERFFDSLPDDFVTEVFTKYVKGVSGLAVDGVTVTDGAGLLAVCDQQVVIDVLRAVESFARLSGAEKNASSSRSTSEPAAPMVDGNSAAPSADREDGTMRETATEIPAGVS